MHTERNDLPYVRFADIFFYIGKKDTCSIAYDCRLFWMIEGDGHLCIGEERYSLHRFDLFYIPPAIPYRFDSEKRLTLLSINFDFTHTAASQNDPILPVSVEEFAQEQITELPPEAFSSPFVLRGAESIGTVLESIVQEKAFDGEYSERMASVLLESCLIRIRRARQSFVSTKEQQLVQKLLSYLNEHIADPLCETKIAKELSYHPYYLNRILKKCTGQTIHSYVLRERIRRASALLLTEDATNEQIGARVGIPNAAHFAKLFRRFTGMTPSAYRKNPPLV